ncbi:hypothetical protein Mapa_005936 [Marchantia paleacea]|nr:hypothetical protein Mapa_005936 [Marchantia paleacea]
MPGRGDPDDGLQERPSDVHLPSGAPPRQRDGGIWHLVGGRKDVGEIVCFKWAGGGSHGGCRFETPWIVKTLTSVGTIAVHHLKQQHVDWTSQNIVHGLQRSVRLPGGQLFPFQDAASIFKAEDKIFSPFVQGFLPQVKAGILNLSQWGKKGEGSVSTSKDELGELEERALAQALARRKPATIIEFYSPRCTLCRSLVSVVTQLERKHEDWLHIVMVDVENKRWLPEVMLYDVKYVPCFLLLDSYGNALVKTGVPYSRKHVLQGLSYILESMKPIKNRVKYLSNNLGNAENPS